MNTNPNEDPTFIRARLEHAWEHGTVQRPSDALLKGEKYMVIAVVCGEEAAIRFISRLRPDHDRDVYVDADARMFLSTDKAYFVPDYIAPRTVKYFVEATKVLRTLAQARQAAASARQSSALVPAVIPTARQVQHG